MGLFLVRCLFVTSPTPHCVGCCGFTENLEGEWWTPPTVFFATSVLSGCGSFACTGTWNPFAPVPELLRGRHRCRRQQHTDRGAPEPSPSDPSLEQGCSQQGIRFCLEATQDCWISLSQAIARVWSVDQPDAAEGGLWGRSPRPGGSGPDLGGVAVWEQAPGPATPACSGPGASA